MTKKTLVIVESPAKAKTINRYLGRNYQVIASMGHIIDLPKSRMAVNIDKNFEPDYITVRGRGKILDSIKKNAGISKEVLLASDNDREGEAISWHIKNAIISKFPDLNVKRIVFNEITKQAIQDSLKNPEEIDLNKVNAQKARRVLDRIVGYSMSPFLWEKVKKGLSAGRVQSVALKLICQREDEIINFKPEEYWTIEGIFADKKCKFSAKLAKYDKKTIKITSEKDAKKLTDELLKENYTISLYQEKERQRKPSAPFTTSKLQQESSNRLNFNSQKTMQIAQELYEGVDIGKERVGLITYMRTDSTRISNQAMEQVRDYIKDVYGKNFLPNAPQLYKNQKGSQDAHECIRPTDISLSPEKLKGTLTSEHFRLYSLIWSRFVASQMEAAIYSQTIVEITGGKGLFRTTASKLKFPGFLKVYSIEKDDDENVKLPKLELEQKLTLSNLEKEQHFTEPPPRYTDASIVKKLEESGIGRPSTYAPTIATILKRYYIVRKQKNLMPTELGKLTNDMLLNFFSDIINEEFTAEMEENLDKVEENVLNWVDMLKSFYTTFEKTVNTAKQKAEKVKANLDEKTDEVCEKCGSVMVKKLGKNGYFLACSAFPKCSNAKPIPLGPCPKKDCDGKIIHIKMRGKRAFYGCTKYPECDFTTWDKPSGEFCKKCGHILVEKYSKDKGMYLTVISDDVCIDPNCEYRKK